MEQPYRPRALRVMAEHAVEDPVWDGDLDHLGPVVLADLGVSAPLIRRLRAWNGRFADPDERHRWQREGLHLAHELQHELPDIEISYFDDGDPRPIRDRRGR